MKSSTPLVVVTGAAGGIGSAITMALQEAGFRVAGVDRARTSSADPHIAVDLAEPGSVRTVAEVIGEQPLRGLVNNAALSTAEATSDLDASDWDRILAVNLRAPFFLAESLLPNLAADEGSVVNVSSVHAQATSPSAVPYAASKGGLVSLTRAQAVDWASRGVRVRANVVLPGAIDTPMLRDGLSRTGASLSELAARHPSGRVGRPEEVAALVRWLLSDESTFVNGAAIPIDGGALAQLSTEPRSSSLPSSAGGKVVSQRGDA